MRIPLRTYRSQPLSASIIRVMGRVADMLSTIRLWQTHGVGTFLELLELLPAHRAAKSKVTFSELPHNGSFWHELSATPEPFLGANYMLGRCEAWGQPTWRPHEEVPEIRDW